jgi:hypothetical protein
MGKQAPHGLDACGQGRRPGMTKDETWDFSTAVQRNSKVLHVPADLENCE